MYSTSGLSTIQSAKAKYPGFVWPWQIPGAIAETLKPQSKVDEESESWLKKLGEASGTPPADDKGKKFPTVPVVIIGASVAALFFYYRSQHKKGKTFMQSVLPFIDLKKA